MAIDLNQRLSEHFTLAEFCESETATRRGWRNIPPEGAIICIKALCVEIAEPIRQYLGLPLIVTSGYRCNKLNDAIGSKDTSQHRKGQAMDFHYKHYGISNRELINLIVIRLKLPYDQLILEFGDFGWVHVSHNCYKKQQRGQILSIDKRGTRIVTLDEVKGWAA
jgi:hypothetical protein